MTNWTWKLVVPSKDRSEVLRECHDDPKSAHLGIQKTIDRVLDRYYWPGMSKDIKAYVKNCQTCHMSKSSNVKPYGLFGKYREAHDPWRLISAILLVLSHDPS